MEIYILKIHQYLTMTILSIHLFMQTIVLISVLATQARTAGTRFLLKNKM